MVDTDGDGLDDEEETYYNTKQLCADTDGDNLSDGEEIDLWFDPTDPNPDGDSYNDKEEKDNSTNPFVYDLNFEEAGEEWSKGALLGDFETADNVPALLGHITGSFIPYIDGRDFIANVKNGDYKAAALNLFGLALDIFTGPIGAAYDVTKGFTKLSRFAAKYSDDAPKVVQAITKASEYFPEAEKVIPDLAKVLPASALDDLADSVKNGSKLTKNEYKQIKKIIEATDKNIDMGTALKPQKLLDELLNSGKKFNYNEVVAITKSSDGKLVWLEIGKETGKKGSSGLRHIETHASQFADVGIEKEELPKFIITAISDGKVIGTQGRTRNVYEIVYKGKKQRVAIEIGSNGYIVGANPNPNFIP